MYGVVQEFGPAKKLDEPPAADGEGRGPERPRKPVARIGQRLLRHRDGGGTLTLTTVHMVFQVEPQRHQVRVEVAKEGTSL